GDCRRAIHQSTSRATLHPDRRAASSVDDSLWFGADRVHAHRVGSPLGARSLSENTMRNWIVALVFLQATTIVHAQTPAAAPAGPPPTGLVVGSGNFFSPIVADLDKAVAFYRDGLGLDVQGAPANADANPALRNMFGLPNAKLRQQIARTPALAGGVEIVEISTANGKAVERRAQDPGAVTLVATVRDIDATLARLQRLGAPVVTRGG